ncbi:unnamed protein product [Pseudo-nitzschia multistriata]|uniref:Uncharacterized protein n=1 Tax=Pseudo-nitzschia multistriata TaxID=183589 RepID=A0A448Z3V4_9STRA|nr:unnamed protein product [Pseudo-nitzschia multistriata]
MVASSNSVTVARGGVGASRDDTVLDDLLLSRCGTSPHIMRRRMNSPSSSTANRNPQKESSLTASNTRKRLQVELERQRLFPPLNDGKNSTSSGTVMNKNNTNQHMRRVRSDNLAQSKRDDPSVRRSIFGPYFQEKPRSNSVPHLVRSQLPPPPPPLTPPLEIDSPVPAREEPQAPIRSFRRSSSDFVVASKKNGDKNDGRHRRKSQEQLHRHNLPVDYRVFAPSQHQAATSAICYRYRELNRDHEKEYDSVLERQVSVEHSLPPFPSPLIRFCSETTTTVAGNDSFSLNTTHPNGIRRSSSNISSHDREIHYHGVYSLLTPISILRPSRYAGSKRESSSDSNVAVDTGVISQDSAGVTSYTRSNNKRNATIEEEAEEGHHHLSASMSASFNFPRSYIDSSPILKAFVASPTDDGSFSGIHLVEEKKESDIAPQVPLGAASVASSLKPTKFLAPDISRSDEALDGRPSSGITAAATDGKFEKDTFSDKDTTDTVVLKQPLQQEQQQKLRFDPRVTVTEFEDPIPRKWYDENELDQHKREAIAIAQNYLRQHRAVAEWYRRSTLDPVTNTYRKKALFSLPVFSSMYSDNRTENSQESPRGAIVPSEPRIRKILIVEPNPAILSLFHKSMKSMFESAEIVAARSSEKALRLVEESIAPTRHDAAAFDIIVIEQALAIRGNHGAKRSDTCLPGLLGMFLKKNHEPIISAVPSTKIHRGSELIEQLRELSLEQQTQFGNADPPRSSLLIGVSLRPERDGAAMRQAGADLVWGIPIPSVGRNLRNDLVSKLQDKRSATARPTSTPLLPDQSNPETK